MAVRDRSIIFPGWYWYDYPVELEPQVAEFFRENAAAAAVRAGYTGSTIRVAIFEVTQNIRWTLYGLPTKAPKGVKTTLDDIRGGGGPPSKNIAQLLEELGETAKRTAGDANSALKLLLWGAVAVVLVNLFRATDTRED